MRFNKKDYVIIFILFSTLTIFGIFYKNKYLNNDIPLKNDNNKIYSKIDSSSEPKNNTVENKLYVHIDGAVNKPGLYAIDEGDRLKHLIDKAGGLTEEADNSKINLAMKVKDEMKIHIYKIGESQISLDNSNSTVTENQEKGKTLININTADKNELMKITGIGEIKAEKIIEYREKNKFQKIEDIIKVNGIGKKTFEKIKNEITVN